MPDNDPTLIQVSQSKRILLLAEDNDEVRDICAQVLRAAGYEVIEAANGVDALVAIGRQRIDLLLTDLRMPLMDGVELAKKMKQDARYAAIPIVLLTATPMADSWKALDLFSALLIKPCPLEEVVRTVASIA